MSRSNAHLTAEDRSRRRKLAFLAVAAALAIGGWVGAIALIGGSDPTGSDQAEGGDRQALGEGGGSPGESPDRIQATTPATDDGRDSESRQTGGGDGSAGGEDRPESSPHDQGGGGIEERPPTEPPSQTREPAPDEGSPGDGATRGLDVLSAESTSGDSAGEGPGANSGESPPDPSPQDAPEPSTPSPTDPGGDDSSSQDKTGPRTSSDQGRLGEGGKSRAAKAVESFLIAAYGYTGADREAYLSGIEEAAGPEIYDSPGGERLAEYGSYGPDCGMASKAALQELEVVETDPSWAAVTAYFTVEDGGVGHRFTQNQMLSIDAGGDYEVAGVGVEELISDTNPRESCPGGELPRRGEGEQTPESGGEEDSSGNTSEESSDEQAPGEKAGGEEGSGEDSAGGGGPEISTEEANQARRAVRAHYEAIGRGEFEEAYSYFGPAFRARVEEEGWTASHRQDGIKDATVHSVKLTRFSRENAKAEVGVSFSDKTGESRFDLTWELVETEGDWKLNKLKSTDRKGGG